MLGRKFKFAIWTAALLWMIVLIQIVVTRLYVSHTDFAQAFARNQLTIEESTPPGSGDTGKLEEKDASLEGYVPGELGLEEREKLAEDLFRTMGGSCVFDNSGVTDAGYYVAYGYTNGLASYKRVNGHRINLNVAIRYDKTKDRTHVIMGTPIINSDY